MMVVRVPRDDPPMLPDDLVPTRIPPPPQPEMLHEDLVQDDAALLRPSGRRPQVTPCVLRSYTHLSDDLCSSHLQQNGWAAKFHPCMHGGPQQRRYQPMPIMPHPHPLIRRQGKQQAQTLRSLLPQ